jgi:hypothetical protein
MLVLSAVVTASHVTKCVLTAAHQFLSTAIADKLLKCLSVMYILCIIIMCIIAETGVKCKEPSS